MEVRHLKLIKTIADEKGISKSLHKLFLTQSAVSHQLKDIEERIGVKIFYRTKNQWILTEEGKVLYDTATRVLDELELANTKIHDLRMGHVGDIRISTECYTSYHWLPAFMVKMKLLYPKLNVKIVMEATHKPLQKLLNNELDVGITSDPLNDKSIRYIELFKDEVMAVVPTGHPLGGKKYLTAQDIANEVLIIHSYPLETVTVYQHFLKEQKVQPAEILAIPLTEVALEMVKAGMGIMTMPVWALKPFAASESVSLVKIGAKGLIRTHYAAIRHEDSHKKHILEFIDNLKRRTYQIMDYQIRQAELSDIDELMLMIAAHAEYEKAVFSPERKAERLIAAIFETSRLNCQVVEEAGELIGYATYTFDYSTWDAAEFMYLDCLFLKEKARGQKIGEHIIGLLKEIGTARGCINIQWQTPDFNEPAIRFYKRMLAKGLKKVRFTLNLT